METTDDMGLAQAGPARAPPGDSADAASASAAVRAELPLTLLAAGYHLRQINAVRARFDGNPVRLVLPLVLWLAAQRADPRAAVAQAVTVVLASLGLETGPPSYSLREIETATGIARETLRRTARQLEDCGWMARAADGEFAVTYETTRRKLARLCDRGFVTRDADGLYWVRPETREHFRAFNRQQRTDMLATAATIEALLQTPPKESSGER